MIKNYYQNQVLLQIETLSNKIFFKLSRLSSQLSLYTVSGDIFFFFFLDFIGWLFF